MKIIAAYMLAVLGGNERPTAEDLKGILGSVGAEADDDKIELLLEQVEGKDFNELIASGMEKLATSAVAGGGGVAVTAAAPTVAGAGGPAAAETKKEEKKKEEKPESDDEDTLFGLFE